MTFLLSSQNIFEYLNEHELCELKESELSSIKQKSCKNFNLIVKFPNRHLLVKQERHNQKGKTKGEFLKEWRIQEFFKKFPKLCHIRSLISEAIHYDPQRSIIVLNYLDDYCDVTEFYSKEQVFPTEIASAVGYLIASIHRSTLDCQEYKEFLVGEEITVDKPLPFVQNLESIEPEIFGSVCADDIKFFALYQRYDSLKGAIAQLITAFEPCCLTHNDLKLNNILLRLDWQQAAQTAVDSPGQTEGYHSVRRSIIRLIDWEKYTWGDPAFDLGMAIASYLKIWLSSLAISTDIDLQTSLRLAIHPLQTLQPSIVALTKAYFAQFPQIIQRRPDFLLRVMQFTGLGLIKKILIMLQYQEPFGNIGICMLQVAKTLLCNPMQSIPTVFGTTASELIPNSSFSSFSPSPQLLAPSLQLDD